MTVTITILTKDEAILTKEKTTVTDIFPITQTEEIAVTTTMEEMQEVTIVEETITETNGTTIDRDKVTETKDLPYPKTEKSFRG